MNITAYKFEQGPIRPPSEARSLLIRFTRNCPWNRCLFCPVYKGKKFSFRPIEDIKNDIQIARDIADEVKSISWQLGLRGEVTDEVISYIFGRPYSSSFRNVAMWLYYGEGSVFIQDANSLVMKTEDMVEALQFLTDKFPDIKRITSYARAKTIAKKDLSELIELRKAGLSRIHIGLESGYDPVLKFVKKGVTAQEHIEAGKKVVEAGITLSEYVMPGLGGKRWWKEHAVQSAKVLNEINPHFIRLRSLRIPRRVPLYEKLQSGEFEPLSDDEIAREIRLFIERLDGITSTLTSDHIMNLLEEVEGTFPNDKEKMLAIIDEYLSLPDEERLLYRFGRRGGIYRSLSDLRDPQIRIRIKAAMDRIQKEEGDIEQVISDMVDQYV